MKNIGPADRIVRLGLVACVIVAFMLHWISGVAGLALGAVALVLLLTSMFSTCPAYMPFGISTRRR
jgi:type IV secretory pathway TrbD component